MLKHEEKMVFSLNMLYFTMGKDIVHHHTELYFYILKNHSCGCMCASVYMYAKV